MNENLTTVFSINVSGIPQSSYIHTFLDIRFISGIQTFSMQVSNAFAGAKQGPKDRIREIRNNCTRAKMIDQGNAQVVINLLKPEKKTSAKAQLGEATN